MPILIEIMCMYSSTPIPCDATNLIQENASQRVFAGQYVLANTFFVVNMNMCNTIHQTLATSIGKHFQFADHMCVPV